MYCSSCGTAVAPDLSYCNRCGAKLSGAKGNNDIKSAGVSPEALVRAMSAVFVFGLIAIIALLAVMKGVNPFNEAFIKLFVILSFLLMFGIEGVFVWLLLRRKRSGKETGDAPLLKEQTTKELDAAQARALPEPVLSVTENTTRTLEPIYSERKAE